MKKIAYLFMIYALMFVSVNAQENVTVSTSNLGVSKGSDVSFRINFNEVDDVAVAGVINIASENTDVATVDVDRHFFDTGLQGEPKYLDVTVHGVSYGTTNIDIVLFDVATFEEQIITGTIKVNVNVGKENAVCPTLTEYNGIYDGNTHTITLSGGSGGTIQYRTSTTGTWNNILPTRKDSGTTTVFVRVLGDENHNTVDCGSKTITVNKANAVITCSNKDYTGTTQTIASCSGGTISGANQINVGEYNIQCVGDSNHFDAAPTKCQINDTPIVTTSEATVTDSDVIFEINYNYNLSYSEIKRRLNKNNLQVYDKNNNLVTSDSAYIGTGGKIKSLNTYYDIIVKGDINGDAKISTMDYVAIRNHILGTKVITDSVTKKASDMNGDNAIKTIDYIAIRKIIMKG